MVFELKLDTNGGLEAAKRQLEERHYASAYCAEGKAVYSIAVVFNASERGIEDYAITRESF